MFFSWLWTCTLPEYTMLMQIIPTSLLAAFYYCHYFYLFLVQIHLLADCNLCELDTKISKNRIFKVKFLFKAFIQLAYRFSQAVYQKVSNCVCTMVGENIVMRLFWSFYKVTYFRRVISQPIRTSNVFP